MENIAHFRQLFETHFTPLVKYAHTILGDKEQAKDIVQSFFVQVLQKHSLGEFDCFEAFAFVVVRNKCLTWLKTQKRFMGEIPEILELGDDQSYKQDSQYPKFLLESAIRNLPKKCREVFMLSKLDGLTYTEIAHTLGISVKTVERQMGIGLTKLRVALEPYKEVFANATN